jgi:prepilin-type processing-associated H-X9-DG protein
LASTRPEGYNESIQDAERLSFSRNFLARRMDDFTDGNRDRYSVASAPQPPQFGLRMLFALVAIVALLSAGATSGHIGFFVTVIALCVIISEWARWKHRPVLSRLMDIPCLVALGAALWCSLPTPPGSKEVGRLGMCANTMKNLAVALQLYENDHGKFPPAYTSGTSGDRLHSWRTLVLPYLERKRLFKEIRLDASWNSAANQALMQFNHELFYCPADDISPGMTSYVAVIAPGSIWSVPGGAKLSDIKDDPQDTILFIEMHSSGISWAEPRDLDLNNLPPGITKQNLLHSLSNHAGGFNAAFADGHVEFIPETIPWADFEAMLTIAGDEKVDRSKW